MYKKEYKDDIKRRKVVRWFAEGMTPYWNAYFSELAREHDVDLYVHYRIGVPGTHPWKFSGTCGYKHRNFVKPRIIPDPPAILSVISKRDAMFVFAGTKGLSKVIMLFLVIMLNRRFIYLNDTFPDNYLNGLKGILVRRLLLSLVFRYAEKVLSTGTAGVERLIKFGCPQSKTVNFPYFIEIPGAGEIRTGDKIVPPGWENRINQDDVVFLASGLFIERKGFDIILEGFSRYLHRNDARGVKLIIAGDGPLKERLRQNAKELHLNDNVYFTGWVDPDRLEEFYGMGDAFIHMARFEPYGVVVLEAMARKLPVIGSDGTMAVLDRVHHGENGFIIQSGNVDELTETIEFCRTHIDRLRSMGKAARESAEKWPPGRGVKIIKDILEA